MENKDIKVQKSYNPPVICRTMLVFLIPTTLFGRGRKALAIPFVGLMLLVGLRPPPVSCLKIPGSPPYPIPLVGLMLLVGLNPPPVICRKIPGSPLYPVNCLAMVVVPVNCGATFPGPV